jgi:hypothetical protein
MIIAYYHDCSGSSANLIINHRLGIGKILQPDNLTGNSKICQASFHGFD